MLYPSIILQLNLPLPLLLKVSFLLTNKLTDIDFSFCQNKGRLVISLLAHLLSTSNRWSSYSFLLLILDGPLNYQFIKRKYEIEINGEWKSHPSKASTFIHLYIYTFIHLHYNDLSNNKMFDWNFMHHFYYFVVRRFCFN